MFICSVRSVILTFNINIYTSAYPIETQFKSQVEVTGDLQFSVSLEISELDHNYGILINSADDRTYTEFISFKLVMSYSQTPYMDL